jgi:hypothetical protein
LVHSLSWVIAHARREEGEEADKLVAKTKRQLTKEVKRTVEIWDEVDREMEEEERAREQQRQLEHRKLSEVDGGADADVDEPTRPH